MSGSIKQFIVWTCPCSKPILVAVAAVVSSVLLLRIERRPARRAPRYPHVESDKKRVLLTSNSELSGLTDFLGAPDRLPWRERGGARPRRARAARAATRRALRGASEGFPSTSPTSGAAARAGTKARARTLLYAPEARASKCS